MKRLIFRFSRWMLAGCLLAMLFSFALRYPAAPDRLPQTLSPEMQSLLALTRQNWQRIRSVEGEKELRSSQQGSGLKQVVRFAYRFPNLFREESLSATLQSRSSAPSLTVSDGKTMRSFSPFMWTLTRASPRPQPLLECTPGAADLTAVASRYRSCSFVEDASARKSGLQVVEFYDPWQGEELSGPAVLISWSRDISYQWLRFWVSRKTGAVYRYQAYYSYASDYPSIDWLYQDWWSSNGATLARRVRHRLQAGVREDVIYKNLRINQTVPVERFRLKVPGGAAILPSILPPDSLRAALRYIQRNPGDAGGHAHYARLLLINCVNHERRFERGLAEIRKAIGLAPGAGRYRAEYAGYIRHRDPYEAARQLEAVVKVCPQAVSFWRDLVQTYFDMKDFRKAGHALRRGIAHTKPDIEWATSLRIALHSRKGETDTALKLARAAWRSEGQLGLLLQTLSECAKKGKTAKRALSELYRLMENRSLPDQDFTYVLSHLLPLERDRGGPEAFRRAWLKAFHLRPISTLSSHYFALADVERKALLPGIVRRLEKEARRHPKDGDIKYLLARIFQESGRKREAVQLLKELVRETDDPNRLNEYASGLTSLGEELAAWKAQQAFLKRYPYISQVRQNLFSAYYHKGHFREALEVYGDPLKDLLSYRHPYTLLPMLSDDVLTCYREAGKMNDLINRIKRILKHQPDSFVLQLALGDAWHKAGKAGAARQTWMRLTRRKGLLRPEQIVLAHRLEKSGLTKAALHQCLKAAQAPVSPQEIASRATMRSGFFPRETDEYQSQFRLLSSIAQLQEKLGRNDEARQTRRRMTSLPKAFGVEDFILP